MKFIEIIDCGKTAVLINVAHIVRIENIVNNRSYVVLTGGEQIRTMHSYQELGNGLAWTEDKETVIQPACNALADILDHRGKQNPIE